MSLKYPHCFDVELQILFSSVAKIYLCALFWPIKFTETSVKQTSMAKKSSEQSFFHRAFEIPDAGSVPGGLLVFSGLQLLLPIEVKMFVLKLCGRFLVWGELRDRNLWRLPWVVLVSQWPHLQFLLDLLYSLLSVFLALTSVAVFDNVSRLRLTHMHPQITYVWQTGVLLY